jgi:hypothetical protein
VDESTTIRQVSFDSIPMRRKLILIQIAESNEGLISMIGSQTDYMLSSKGGLAKKQMQAMMVLELINVDREKGRQLFSAWERFLTLGSSQRSVLDFEALDKYIPYRIEDAAWQ